MIEAFVAALVVAAGAAYWLVTRRARTRSRPSQQAKAGVAQPAKAGGRFGAVHIRARSSACGAARALEGQRFLSKDAPSLPLPECSAAQCSCRFAKLSDRRTEGRRLEQGSLSTSLFIATNRRAKRDRRRAAPSQRG
jgi:hypothetical protein